MPKGRQKHLNQKCVPKQLNVVQKYDIQKLTSLVNKSKIVCKWFFI